MASDGRWLFIGVRRGPILVLDSTDLTRRPTSYPAHGQDASAAAISSDGRSLATGGDDRVVIIWDVAAGGQLTQRFRLVGQSDRVTSLAFSPDGHLLASGGEDGAVILWDLQRGERIGEPVQLSGLPAVAFTIDQTSDWPGLQLEVAAAGLARWPMRPQAWAGIACRVIGGRTLDDVEKQQYLRGSTPAASCP